MAWFVDKDFSTPQPFFNFTENPRFYIGAFGPCINIPLTYPEKKVVAVSEKPLKKKKLARDVFFVDGVTCCNQRFKDLVERFEPGMHLFFPIELQDADGAPLDGGFYHFTAQQDVDCILTDNNPDWFRLRNPNDPSSNINSTITRIASRAPHKGTKFEMPGLSEIFLSKPMVVGRHLWTPGILGWSYLFFSYEFRKAWGHERMRGLDVAFRCKELERPWIAEDQMGPMLPDWQEYVASGRTKWGQW
jgi:hypothetical protein